MLNKYALLIRRKGFLAAIFLLAAAALPAQAEITSIEVDYGSWNGSFQPNGQIWNTFLSANWAIGATNPGYGNSLPNSFNNVALTGGEYWLYLADSGGGNATALRITLGQNTGGNLVDVFTAGSGVNQGNFVMVSGAGFRANLVAGPQTTYELVGIGQTYYPTGSSGRANLIIDINTGTATPEPSCFLLMAGGLGMVAAARLRR